MFIHPDLLDSDIHDRLAQLRREAGAEQALRAGERAHTQALASLLRRVRQAARPAQAPSGSPQAQ